jgi:integrase
VQHERALFLTAAVTGLRQGELMGLCWRDMDWAARRIRQRSLLGANRHIWVEILHALGQSRQDRELAAAVRLLIAQSDLRRACDRLGEAAADPWLAELGSELPDATLRAQIAGLAAHRWIDPDFQLGRFRTFRLRAAQAMVPRTMSGVQREAE